MKRADYTIADAEDMARRYPKTTSIPDADLRRNFLSLTRDDHVPFVKLVFEPRDGGGGDKMWVRVTGRRGGRYVGVLDNEPTGAFHRLRLGDEVTFSARDIFDIVARRARPPRRSVQQVLADLVAGL